MSEIFFESKHAYGSVTITDKIIKINNSVFNLKSDIITVNIDDIVKVKYQNFSPSITLNTVCIKTITNNTYNFSYRRSKKKDFEPIKKILEKINACDERIKKVESESINQQISSEIVQDKISVEYVKSKIQENHLEQLFNLALDILKQNSTIKPMGLVRTTGYNLNECACVCDILEDSGIINNSNLIIDKNELDSYKVGFNVEKYVQEMVNKTHRSIEELEKMYESYKTFLLYKEYYKMSETDENKFLNPTLKEFGLEQNLKGKVLYRHCCNLFKQYLFYIYNEKCSKLKCDLNDKTVISEYYEQDENNVPPEIIKYNVWKKENKLIFICSFYNLYNTNIPFFEIKNDEIVYYKKIGKKEVNTIISGGGTKSSSHLASDMYYLNKALGGKTNSEITGAMLAEINSREIEPISTQEKIYDDRRILLKLESKELYFSIDSYESFLKLIPEKDYDQITIKKNNSNGEIKDKLVELKNLFDEGLISEEEYHKKRKDTLDQL